VVSQEGVKWHAGLRTLLVTTDPAAHIGAVLGRAVGVEPVPVPGVEHLAAVEVDARAATAAYKDAVLVDARTRFDAATVARIAEEVGSPTHVVATGGFAVDLARLSHSITAVDPLLTLAGLARLHSTWRSRT